MLTVTNFRSACDIVPIISLGQKTDALLDQLGLEDHFIINLCNLVENIRSSKWSATLTSPEWGLSSDSAGDLYDALMEDLVLIDKTVSLHLSAVSFHPLMPLNSQEHPSKTNLSSQSLLVECSATTCHEVIDFLLLRDNANIYYNSFPILWSWTLFYWWFCRSSWLILLNRIDEWIVTFFMSRSIYWSPAINLRAVAEDTDQAEYDSPIYIHQLKLFWIVFANKPGSRYCIHQLKLHFKLFLPTIWDQSITLNVRFAFFLYIHQLKLSFECRGRHDGSIYVVLCNP